MSQDNSKQPVLPEQRGPWLRTSYDVVYENPWIRVSHETVKTPANTDGIYGFVHFKGRAVGVIPVDEQGNTRLVGQFRYTLNEFSWEIPMGGGKFDEALESVAKRELLEETGLVADNVQQILKLHTSNSITDEAGYVYIATNLQQAEQALEDTEADMQVKTVSLAEAISMIHSGHITDGICVAGLFGAEKFLQNR